MFLLTSMFIRWISFRISWENWTRVVAARYSLRHSSPTFVCYCCWVSAFTHLFVLLSIASLSLSHIFILFRLLARNISHSFLSLRVSIFSYGSLYCIDYFFTISFLARHSWISLSSEDPFSIISCSRRYKKLCLWRTWSTCPRVSLQLARLLAGVSIGFVRLSMLLLLLRCIFGLWLP